MPAHIAMGIIGHSSTEAHKNYLQLQNEAAKAEALKAEEFHAAESGANKVHTK